MSTSIRFAASVLAALVLVTTGCSGNRNNDEAEPDTGLDDQRAAMISEFERTVEEAQYLRDDIAALREDMRAVRDATNEQVESASRDAVGLRDEVAAIRLEMEQLNEAAALKAERSAEEVKSLREQITVIRDDMSAIREAAENAESLSEDLSELMSEADEYPEPLVYEDEIRHGKDRLRRVTRSPVSGMYGPLYQPRYVPVVRHNDRRVGRRYVRSQNKQAGGSRVTGTKPAPIKTVVSNPNSESPGMPGASRPSTPGVSRPSTPSSPSVSRPSRPSVSRPSTPSARPSAPAPKPAPKSSSVPQRKIHTPVRER